MNGKKKETKPIYICDPGKFKVCSWLSDKNWCGVECFCTTHKQFAKDPNHPLTYEEYYGERDRRKEDYIKERIERGNELD